jgi:hypothetical protein
MNRMSQQGVDAPGLPISIGIDFFVTFFSQVQSLKNFKPGKVT